MNPKMLASEAAEIQGNTIQYIHKQIKSLDITTEKSQNRVFFGHTGSRVLFNFKFLPTVYSCQLVKGGVGKSVLAFNIAIRASLLGAKTALIELDQQANLTRTFGIDATKRPVMIDVINENINIYQSLITVADGLDFLPSRVDNALLDNTLMLGKHPLDKVLRNLTNQLKKTHDVIIIDCPPSIGAAVSAAALASDVIIMPVNPSDYSIAGLDLTYRELSSLFLKYDYSANFKIVFNKYDGRTSLSFDTLSFLIKHNVYGKFITSSYIRSLQSIENCITKGTSVYETIKTTPEKDDFSSITKDILGVNY